ncbi:hypothetical protein L9F63_024458 [Diploptera punctata]|uniref:Uncharacterized protein n=1 Tax=Diploptera punctata TaxID=6984 RepID=A0AAD8E7B9_DIPPU|nr:hypothetical protein L9F63_024458 [Diploptera punctata]
MVFMAESIPNVNRNSSQCNVFHMESDKMDESKDSGSEKNALPVVRSVAMSENIARSVREEVKHLIHVESPVNNVLAAAGCLVEVEKDPGFSLGKAEYHSYGTNSSVSYILPSIEESIVSAVILSKWDDIMGPQTVHVWLREEAKSVPCHSDAKNKTCLTKAVKYVTCHTVNYTGSSCVSSNSADSTERSNSIFVVPELDLIAQSLVFQLRDQELNVPYSLALMVSYQHYNYFLHLRQLCRHWLQRMAARLHVILLKCFSTHCSFEASEQVNGWMLDMCNMMASLKTYGLATVRQMYNRHVLNHPLLERIVTSHLQTFGCTVVVGASSEDINSLILFLGNSSFHSGLFLQGLLLNEFGCRQLCSVELAANPYPVTAVDLTRGVQSSAVKQSPLHHLHLARRRQMAQREHRQLCENEDVDESDHQLHESVLHSVKEGANLVISLLEDLRHLPSGLWTTYIGFFKQKLDTLAYTLLNLVTWMRSESDKLNYSKHLSQALDISEADLLIVLAVAEKFQPGIYTSVMGSR